MSGHTPRKRFGQNFLTDQGVIQAIVSTIHPQPDDVMVEIGPGLGALTDPLLKTLPRLHVVEIDRDIIARLQNNYPASKLTIHAGDALKFDFSALGERIRVVGNLPYNISTPLLFHLSDYVGNIIDMHFMLQKEVVERMVAEPSTSEFGRLSVMLQYRYAMELMFIVPPDAFQPAPKVESAIVRMIPHAVLPHPAKDEALFAAIVTAAFGQRRKVLRNTLKAYLDSAGFEALGIDPGLRAENLGVAEFVKIANYCKK
ncbi:dimethyladenosine transferase [Sulfuricella denitrificans skB26]|uniref:Ribosomal RNA small subunit methyltransferase A n=1 Tax=Sulfuricella denitrificans (strain DSM 22764 / NBRC 105220 / skB26) TaxID=1163617 RepID=S6AND8_SULDS|nr:16S rRNA (adenine(1518)-N(6)/adenine(1519)-N(6))-dimethyltransferase RsmA [Sulfuricella denitrificans]BAN36364.1 dimethyladenosine transferase [Sulfuricella denitrificans skB26]